MSGGFTSDKNLQTVRNISNAMVGAHAEYNYWKASWEAIRDCIIGEYEVKRKGQTYLPKLAGHTDPEYSAYLDRAYFYNMTSRTVNGLVGTVFRKEPRIQNVPKKVEKSLKTITKSKTDIKLFTKEIAYEILSVGRYGVLLDMPRDGGDPFLVGYVTENIIDWTVSEVDGRFVLTEVVLRELEEERMVDTVKGMRTPSTKYKANYRILRLEGGVYKQYIFRDKEEMPAFGSTATDEVITPLNTGRPFNFIPFMFFGPMTNGAAIEKSPILDIVLMNLSHYQTAAMLEHGRFYTAMPVYHMNVASVDESKGTYTVGPSVVWEWSGDKAPGIIEYHGHGLGFLEKGLDAKEQHISALGGRMLGVRSTAVAESDNLVKLKEKNEQSLLLNVTTTINIGMSQLLTWYCDWKNASAEDITLELNQDFLFEGLSAREFRAFALLYKEGLLPIEAMYQVFRKAEIVPEYMSYEEFLKQINNASNFPNNPDITAKQNGFPDAAAEIKNELDYDILDQEKEIADDAAKAQSEAAKAQAKVAVETAKAQAKAKPVAAAPAAKPKPKVT